MEILHFDPQAVVVCTFGKFGSLHQETHCRMEIPRFDHWADLEEKEVYTVGKPGSQHQESCCRMVEILRFDHWADLEEEVVYKLFAFGH